jgi:hypothetical protein
MPNWKRVIVSGSSAALTSVTATAGFTGSLLGTASYAIQALSSSYVVPSATNAFVQGGNSFGTTALLGTNDNQPLAFETNGSTKMFISSSGNVGIGTTSPATRLHVSKTDLSNELVTVRTQNDLSYADFGIQSGYARILSGGNLLYAGSDSATYFYNGGNIVMTMNYLGNVGIGTVNPSYKLDVSGSGNYTNGLTVTGSLFLTSSAATVANFVANNNSALFISGSGDVGIGNTAPDRKLHVKDSAIVITKLEGTSQGSLLDLVNTNASQTYNGLRFTQGTTSKMAITHIADGITKGYVQIGNNWAAGSEILVVDGRTLNVGIGTTNPGAKLEVVGSFRATTKSFIIDHPTKEGKKLQYGVLEGPEHSVYVRGRLTNTHEIILPDYWHALVYMDSMTVTVTPIGKFQELWIQDITDTVITIGSKNKKIDCFYAVFAERKDTAKLITEFDN